MQWNVIRNHRWNSTIQQLALFSCKHPTFRFKASKNREGLTISGKSWKTHPEKYLEFPFSRSSHKPFYWETHPLKIMTTFSFCSILGRHTGCFIGKLIHSNFLTETIYDMWHLVWVSFPIKRSQFLKEIYFSSGYSI